MKVRRHSKYYNFIGDKTAGITLRWGKTFNDDPLLAPWPELADISISNHCTKNCGYCYRDSKKNQSFMRVKDYEYILNSLNHPQWGNVFQVALGGGEPLEHPNFLDFIEVSNNFGIVTNFTSNGIHLNHSIINAIKGKIGAIAISVYSVEELKNCNFKMLVENGIKTNIHFLLSRKSANQATQLLKGIHNNLLSGLNAIIFLTYKTTGRATPSDNLKWDNNLKELLKYIDHNNCNIKIGFDACFVPILLHLTETNINFVDSCECAYFSVYIDENLNVKPCSFTCDEKYTYNMKRYSFSEIWERKFMEYRNMITNECKRECKNKNVCRGACPYFEDITLCFSLTREKSIEL